MEDYFGYTNKICVVTGASSGMGEATARMLVDLGAAVYAIDMNECKVDGITEFIKCNLANKKEIDDLPYYYPGKGLPIGNMTSQFLSIYYLNRLDHKIVHDYKIPCYVKYMDDFILIHQDKEYLKEICKKIENELNDVYKLDINKKRLI